VPGPGSRSGSPKKRIVDSSVERDNRRRVDSKLESPSPTSGEVPGGVGRSGSQTERRINDDVFFCFNFEGVWQYVLASDDPRTLEDQINEEVTTITANVEATDGEYENMTVTGELNVTGATITGLSHTDLDDDEWKGVNTHPQIDTHLANTSNPHSVIASQVDIADGGGIIAATEVEAALQENRTAIDAIEDNTITSPNSSISVSGTIGADNQTVDVVYGNTANTAVQGNVAWSIVAGAGLTGDASGNMGDGVSATLVVGAGAGIKVNADDIEVIYGVVGEVEGIEPGDATKAGTLSKAARVDHQHGIVTATAEDVDLDVSDEGSNPSFSRSDHHHAIDQSIVPTWIDLHTYSAGIQMQTGVKIQFVDANQYISGTASSITIDADDDLYIYTNTSMQVTAPYASFSGTMRINAPYDTTLGYTIMGKPSNGRHFMSGTADYQENYSLLSIYEEGDSYDEDFGDWFES